MALAGAEWGRVPIAWGENTWWVKPAGKNIDKPEPGQSNYFCVSLFQSPPGMKFTRRKESFLRQFVFVVDDVGTKLNEANVRAALPPATYELETSPGNFQFGYKLTDGTDARALEAIVNAIIDDPEINPSLKDPGMKGVTRVVRLPVGSNNKEQWVKDGKGWPHRLTVWEPSRAYRVGELAFSLGVLLDEGTLERFKGAGGTRKATAEELGADPILKLFDMRGMLLDPNPNDNGFVTVVCPWVEEHSDARNEAGYRPGGRGFQCHHGHCEARGMGDLRAWVAEAATPEEQAEALADIFPDLSPEQKTALKREKERRDARAPITISGGLPDIRGGAYEPGELLQAINARFALVDREGEVCIVHRTSRGTDETLAKGSFELYLQNVVVISESENAGEEPKYFPAAKWWKAHPRRPLVRRAIFDPHREARADEYNFWRGFGVTPLEGRGKIKRLLAHIWIVSARRNRTKYRYLVRWLAWAVQNPEKCAETMIIFKGEGEGSGKSIVSETMRILFGTHAVAISDPQELLGAHTDDLEFASFAQIEEALFAGDPKVADRAKHAITGASRRVNPKFRKAYQAPNRMHAILTTNHDWAVHAGKGARRYFVCEVSEEKTGDKSWFDRIVHDLESGGYGQLLRYLQTKKLRGWHPRNMPRTMELAEQQIRSASSVHQWLIESVEQGHIDVYEKGERKGGFSSLQLGASHATSDLYSAYCGAQKEHGGRIEKKVAFARALSKILGEGSRVQNLDRTDSSKSRGFLIPEAETLAGLIETSLGISARVIDRRAPETGQEGAGLEDLPF